MKRFATSLALAAAIAASAQTPEMHISLDLTESRLAVAVDIDLASVKVKTSETALLTPCLVNGPDTLTFAPVAVMGRRDYIQYQRGAMKRILPEGTEVYKAAKSMPVYSFSDLLQPLPWFDGASMIVKTEILGCAGCRKGSSQTDGPETFMPVSFSIGQWLSYAVPDETDMPTGADIRKTRHIEGRANVEFPVNSTQLMAGYRGNRAELDSIRATFDYVRDDANSRITGIAICGFASPEGSYAGNARLAEGRTESLCRYVEEMYGLPKGFIAASSVPEDWAGLREWVAASGLDGRDAMLSVIDDSSLAPDAKEKTLQSRFPEQYARILRDVYPTLRHSDYQIEYEVRSFSDPEEILQVMKTRPANLSLDELMIAARSLEPGSPEFNEIYEVAVRLFPDSEISNLNAGVNALARGDSAAARRYLAKAGTGADADYARALAAVAAEDYAAALPLLERAKAGGVEKATALMDLVNKKMK